MTAVPLAEQIAALRQVIDSYEGVAAAYTRSHNPKHAAVEHEITVLRATLA